MTTVEMTTVELSAVEVSTAEGGTPQFMQPTPRKTNMRSLSIVIPALNEAENIPRVMSTIPREALKEAGWETEVLVVDNGSTDGTGDIAALYGARVIRHSVRGYGSAYKAGFAAACGDVIATGDADCTYPFDALPGLLRRLDSEGLDFLSTNRLGRQNRQAMKPSHIFGNHALTAISRTLFRSPFRDSQSGMWTFRSEILQDLDLRADGMAFSQEIKHEAHLRGFRCGEAAIDYRVRGGVVKLNAGRDGVMNTSQMFLHRVRGGKAVVASRVGSPTTIATTPRLRKEFELAVLT